MNKKIRRIAMLNLSLILICSTKTYGTITPECDYGENLKVFQEEIKNDSPGGYYSKAIHKFIHELNLERSDVDEAVRSGKNLFDLAKDKGYNEDKVKKSIIKYSSEAIKTDLSEGKITKETADQLLKNVNDRISKWDGSIKLSAWRKDSREIINELADIEELGISRDDIEKGRKQNQNFFQIVKSKKGFDETKIKEIIIKSKEASLKDMVTDGKISDQSADLILSKLKEDFSDWDGNLNCVKKNCDCEN
ncbi:hypothetical protein [Clostridium oryzae]|uniref:Uncharacterized protein n=1 Tax=Clostridium oryzae TaxID=1450648 RepID=A0A1V4IBL5_9CLOT|nr:hypothetical protein [Clostridium oryzae]OPJ57319.1 hypothetical protein CLORY_41870 [Clostridium oryzae]